MASRAADVLIVTKFRFCGGFVADLLDYQCRVAGDAEEALELFRQLRPALVVSDRRMPDLSRFAKEVAYDAAAGARQLRRLKPGAGHPLSRFGFRPIEHIPCGR